MIDKVSIEINIVFVEAPQIGEPVRVDGMNHDESGVRRQSCGDAFTQKPNLDSGATETLNAMGSGHQHQNVFCVLWPEQCDIRKKLFAALPGSRVQETFNSAPRSLRRS